MIDFAVDPYSSRVLWKARNSVENSRIMSYFLDSESIRTLGRGCLAD